MNFLFHMLLSGDDDLILVGNFMGDFVKGPLSDRFPERITQGITLHRRIDSYAGRDDLFRQSRRRLDPYYGLYRGVLVDLFYDHFLVRDWNNWSDEPFDRYLARTRSIIESQQAELPKRLQEFVPIIFDTLLPSYGTIAGIGYALERISRRVPRDNPMAGAEKELELNYDGLRADFSGFLPGVLRYSQDLIASGIPSGAVAPSSESLRS